MTTYGDLAQLKVHLSMGTADTSMDTFLTAVLTAVSRELDDYCRGSRSHFYAAGSATARVYTPHHRDLLEVDDISSSEVTIRTDDDDDGVFETTWGDADFQLEPLNGLADSRAAWKVRAVGDRDFPCSVRGRATVEVTATWGWAQVPAPITEASLIQSVRIANRRHSPFGVVEDPTLGTSERLLPALDPDVKMLVRPYVKNLTGN